jgi:hypothetical protein
MFFSTAAVVATLASVAVAAPASPTATDPADVYAAQATALTQSPTSKVKGKAFDRYVSIVWNLFFVCPTGSFLTTLWCKRQSIPLILNPIQKNREC